MTRCALLVCSSPVSNKRNNQSKTTQHHLTRQTPNVPTVRPRPVLIFGRKLAIQLPTVTRPPMKPRNELLESARQGEPPIRVMALQALLDCERSFYLEEVEEIRVDGVRAH